MERRPVFACMGYLLLRQKWLCSSLRAPLAVSQAKPRAKTPARPRLDRPAQGSGVRGLWLGKSSALNLAMAGRTLNLKTKADWQALDRQWVGVPQVERNRGSVCAGDHSWLSSSLRSAVKLPSSGSALMSSTSRR